MMSTNNNKLGCVVIRRRDRGPAVVSYSVRRALEARQELSRRSVAVVLGENMLAEKMIPESFRVRPENEADIIEQVSFVVTEGKKQAIVGLVTENDVVDFEVSYLVEGLYCFPVYNFVLLDDAVVSVEGNFYIVNEAGVELSNIVVYYVDMLAEERQGVVYKIASGLSLYKGETIYPFVQAAPCQCSRDFYFNSISNSTYVMFSLENVAENNLGFDLPGGVCYIYQKNKADLEPGMLLLDKVSLVSWVANSDFKIVTHLKSNEVIVDNISIDSNSYRLVLKNNTDLQQRILIDVNVPGGHIVTFDKKDINISMQYNNSQQFMVQLEPREENNVDYYIVPAE